MCSFINGRNWWDEIDDYLILGAIPFSKDVKKLNDAGVSCIINLCAESNGPSDLYRYYGMEYYQIPTVDFNCPSVAGIDLGVSIIRKHTEQKNKVYIHCKAGRGRSATVVYCWLVKFRNYNSEEAMNYLLKKRPHINKYIHERIPVKMYLQQR